jgi:hypothetical protein
MSNIAIVLAADVGSLKGSRAPAVLFMTTLPKPQGFCGEGNANSC